MRHRQVNETPNQPQRDHTEAEESAAAATKAVSDAIRRQLTTPGSVGPDEQVRLLFADRQGDTILFSMLSYSFIVSGSLSAG